jgi:hypothetical protein
MNRLGRREAGEEKRRKVRYKKSNNKTELTKTRAEKGEAVVEKSD